MKERYLCVIKFNDKWYWCGLGSLSDELRQAQIYVDPKRATEQAEWILKSKKYCVKYLQEKEGKVTYKLVKIKIEEIEE